MAPPPPESGPLGSPLKSISSASCTVLGMLAYRTLPPPPPHPAAASAEDNVAPPPLLGRPVRRACLRASLSAS